MSLKLYTIYQDRYRDRVPRFEEGKQLLLIATEYELVHRIDDRYDAFHAHLMRERIINVEHYNATERIGKPSHLIVYPLLYANETEQSITQAYIIQDRAAYNKLRYVIYIRTEYEDVDFHYIQEELALFSYILGTVPHIADRIIIPIEEVDVEYDFDEVILDRLQQGEYRIGIPTNVFKVDSYLQQILYNTIEALDGEELVLVPPSIDQSPVIHINAIEYNTVIIVNLHTHQAKYGDVDRDELDQFDYVWYVQHRDVNSYTHIPSPVSADEAIMLEDMLKAGLKVVTIGERISYRRSADSFISMDTSYPVDYKTKPLNEAIIDLISAYDRYHGSSMTANVTNYLRTHSTLSVSILRELPIEVRNRYNQFHSQLQRMIPHFGYLDWTTGLHLLQSAGSWIDMSGIQMRLPIRRNSLVSAMGELSLQSPPLLGSSKLLTIGMKGLSIK